MPSKSRVRLQLTSSGRSFERSSMTSFIIQSHVGRQVPLPWAHNDTCAFCRIISGELPARTVYETEKVIIHLVVSFKDSLLSTGIDILPLRAGHTLVIPKAHIPKLSDLPPDLASAVGEAISKVANALTEGAQLLLFIPDMNLHFNAAMSNTGLNVVCNQEYAQAVPHVSAVHCRSELKLLESFLHRYTTTLYLRPSVRLLIQKLLGSEGRSPSRMKRCIRRSLSQDKDLTMMMHMRLRSGYEHVYEAHCMFPEQLSHLTLSGVLDASIDSTIHISNPKFTINLEHSGIRALEINFNSLSLGHLQVSLRQLSHGHVCDTLNNN